MMNAVENLEPRNNSVRRRRLLTAAALVGVLALIAGAIYWLYSRTREWTDDAAIDAHILQISSKVAGQVLRVTVDDNQRVAKDDSSCDEPSLYEGAIRNYSVPSKTTR